MAETWHPNLEGAKEQAGFESGPFVSAGSMLASQRSAREKLMIMAPSTQFRRHVEALRQEPGYSLGVQSSGKNVTWSPVSVRRPKVMLKTILALGALMVFAPCANASERRDYSCSGVPDREGGVREVCDIGFFNLWRSPESFDEKYIRISGFVENIEGRLYMYASKDLYLYSGGRGGISLHGPQEGLEQVRLLAAEGKPVSISGRFFWGSRGAVSESLGAMDVISGMSWVQTPPDQPPQL